MGTHDVTLEYRRSEAQAAGPMELTLMLFDLLLDRLRRAARAVDDAERRTAAVNDALEAIDALQNSVNPASGFALVNKLDLFYSVLRQRVVRAHVDRSAVAFQEQVASVLTLRAAWDQARRKPDNMDPELPRAA